MDHDLYIMNYNLSYKKVVHPKFGKELTNEKIMIL
jgi:hypothetical protein